VARAAVHRRELFRMRDFLYGGVAGDAFQAGMRGRFQGGGIESRGHSRLAFPDTGAGLVAALTILGF